MSEVQAAKDQLGLQEAQSVAEKVKPFVDAEVGASPAIKLAAQEMTRSAINEAEKTYRQTRGLITDPVKAEIVAYRAKPTIDAAAESKAADRKAREAVNEIRNHLYSKYEIEDDFDVFQNPDYLAAQNIEGDTRRKADSDGKLANQVINVLDKSYDTPEGK